MGQLESAAKPLLEPMLAGERASLTPASQLLFAQWLTLKLMVVDRSTLEFSAITSSDRAAFYASRAVPNSLRIWLFRSTHPGWNRALRQQAFNRPSDPVMKMNSKSLTWGFGKLLIYATYAQHPYMDGYPGLDFVGSACECGRPTTLFRYGLRAAN